jgi:hypothetical protein
MHLRTAKEGFACALKNRAGGVPRLRMVDDERSVALCRKDECQQMDCCCPSESFANSRLMGLLPPLPSGTVLILPVISVSLLALRRQNAELDEDIALVLQQHVCIPLDIEIEELDELLESFANQRTTGVTQ